MLFLARVEGIVVDIYNLLYEKFSDKQAEIPRLEEEESTDPIAEPLAVRLCFAAGGKATHMWVGGHLTVHQTNRILYMSDCLSILGDLKRYQAEHMACRDAHRQLSQALTNCARSCYEVSLPVLCVCVCACVCVCVYIYIYVCVNTYTYTYSYTCTCICM